MSNIILLRNNLKDTVANEYSKQIQINNNLFTNEIDYNDISCGDNCESCTNLYTNGIPTNTDNYWAMKLKVGGNRVIDSKDIIFGDPNGPCYPLCHCDIQGVFNNIVVISKKVSDLALKNQSDIDTVINNIIKKMQNDNPDIDYNDYKGSISSIVMNITKNLKSNTDINIEQKVDSAQIIEIRGHGNITGITMNACLGVIMDVLVSDQINIQSLTDITNQSIIHIVQVVNQSFKDGLMNAFKQNVKFFIIIGIGLLCMIGFLILSFFWSAAKSRK